MIKYIFRSKQSAQSLSKWSKKQVNQENKPKNSNNFMMWQSKRDKFYPDINITKDQISFNRNRTNAFKGYDTNKSWTESTKDSRNSTQSKTNSINTK